MPDTQIESQTVTVPAFDFRELLAWVKHYLKTTSDADIVPALSNWGGFSKWNAANYPYNVTVASHAREWLKFWGRTLYDYHTGKYDAEDLYGKCMTINGQGSRRLLELYRGEVERRKK